MLAADLGVVEFAAGDVHAEVVVVVGSVGLEGEIGVRVSGLGSRGSGIGVRGAGFGDWLGVDLRRGRNVF